MSLIDDKRILRGAMLAWRGGLSDEERRAAAMGLVEMWRYEQPVEAPIVVSGFWPLGDEIDIRPLLHALHDRGHAIVLPVTPRRGEALTFRGWQPGDVLLPERFGTMRPVGEVRVPDMLLIPLLAFDSGGRRLGYGGGFYDRMNSNKSALMISACVVGIPCGRPG